MSAVGSGGTLGGVSLGLKAKRKDIQIALDLGAGGTEEATIWTCDLSADYVRINAEYRT